MLLDIVGGKVDKQFEEFVENHWRSLVKNLQEENEQLKAELEEARGLLRALIETSDECRRWLDVQSHGGYLTYRKTWDASFAASNAADAFLSKSAPEPQGEE